MIIIINCIIARITIILKSWVFFIIYSTTLMILWQTLCKKLLPLAIAIQQNIQKTPSKKQNFLFKEVKKSKKEVFTIHKLT